MPYGRIKEIQKDPFMPYGEIKEILKDPFMPYGKFKEILIIKSCFLHCFFRKNYGILYRRHRDVMKHSGCPAAGRMEFK